MNTSRQQGTWGSVHASGVQHPGKNTLGWEGSCFIAGFAVWPSREEAPERVTLDILRGNLG